MRVNNGDEAGADEDDEELAAAMEEDQADVDTEGEVVAADEDEADAADELSADEEDDDEYVPEKETEKKAPASQKQEPTEEEAAAPTAAPTPAVAPTPAAVAATAAPATDTTESAPTPAATTRVVGDLVAEPTAEEVSLPTLTPEAAKYQGQKEAAEKEAAERAEIERKKAEKKEKKKQEKKEQKRKERAALKAKEEELAKIAEEGTADEGLTKLNKHLFAYLGDERSLELALATLKTLSVLKVTQGDLEKHVDFIKALKKVTKKFACGEDDDADVVNEIKSTAGKVYSAWKAIFEAGAAADGAK